MHRLSGKPAPLVKGHRCKEPLAEADAHGYLGQRQGSAMTALDLPRPDWMTEDLVLLEEQARRFIASAFVPHLERWHEEGIYDRDVWTKAGAAGLLCASMPEEYGGAGGTFAHEAVINRELSLAGFDSFGAPLHSGIVAPYILHYGTEEQKKPSR
jgi:acyl-CoA dehydrogenase